MGVDAACRRVCETCKLIGGEEILLVGAGEGVDGIADVDEGEDNNGEGVVGEIVAWGDVSAKI